MEKAGTELQAILSNLIQSWESEVIEFKQADEDYSMDKTREYFFNAFEQRQSAQMQNRFNTAAALGVGEMICRINRVECRINAVTKVENNHIYQYIKCFLSLFCKTACRINTKRVRGF